MDTFKNQKYFNEFNKEMEIWSLDINLSNFIIDNILEVLGLKLKSSSFFKEIYDVFEYRVVIDSINDKGFEHLMREIDTLTFSDENQFFLIWNWDQNVDICSYKILKDSWDSIWYGAGDETLLLYVPGNALILICDWGEVCFKRLGIQ